MIKGLLRKATGLGVYWLIHNYEKISVDLAKIEAVSLYVKTIKDVRLLVMGIIGLVLAANLLMGSFLLLHVAIVWVLPVTTFWKGMILVICFGLYFIATLTGVLIVLSQKLWMKKSKASEMVERTVGRILQHRHA